MDRAQGYFRDGWDHSFSTHEGDRILGGFALVGYIGASMTVHMAAEDPHWFSRDLAWLAFHYAFEQLQLRKLLAAVRSDNYIAIALDMRAGWKLETIITEAFPDAHMIVLSMTREDCPWLDYSPRQWRAA